MEPFCQRSRRRAGAARGAPLLASALAAAPGLAGRAAEQGPDAPGLLAALPYGILAASLAGALSLLAALALHGRGRLRRRSTELEHHLACERRRADAAQRLLVEQAGEQARIEMIHAQTEAIFEGSAEGVVIADERGVVTTANPAARRMLGDSGELVGASLLRVAAAALDRPFLAGVLREIRARDAWRGDARLAHREYGDLPAHVELRLIREDDGALRHVVATLRDLRAEERSQERIVRLTHRDPVTDLPNRTLFGDNLERACRRAGRHGEPVALLFLDLDRFKSVNDTLGHPLGDELLRGVARRLASSLRSDDVVARLGGDEFAVIAEGVRGEEQALVVARKLLGALQRPFEIEGRELFVSASIGLALFPKHGVGPADLLRSAESAMYEAKSLGRNRYAFFRDELGAECSERFRLENDLRRALEEDELVVYYQPVVSLDEGRIVGAEALVRWRHPELGLVSPLRFVPVAEEAGLIGAVGDWVRRRACRDLATWRARGFHEVRVAVNVSGYEMIAGDLSARLRDELEREDLDPAALELEITEGFLLSDSDRALKELDALKRLGVTLAIDDFGTGYSNLGYLQKMPIDKLKIDRSFVMRIPGDTDNEAIARAVIALGRSLNLQVVAEGVENRAQRDFVRREGCHAMQGYLYSPPVCAEDFLALLEREVPARALA